MKKSGKKLELSKMTICNLNISEMNQKVGGLSGACLSPDKKPSKTKP